MKTLTFISLYLFSTMCCSQVHSYIDSAFKGQEYYKVKQYENALDSYQRAKNLQNGIKMSALDRVKLDVELGQTAYRLNEYAKAIEYFQKALDSESNVNKRASLYLNIGNASINLKNVDQAIQYYKKGVKLNQEDLELKYNLSQALRQKAESSKDSNSNESQKNKGGGAKKIEAKSSDFGTQQKAYSFEEQQKEKLLNDLLRQEAQTKRRIEKKSSTPAKNGKDW